ncbi:hypothetical protein AC1031_018468 [Aphanomyces cochlioides]|nr:hypothetical protein AC1031_018468 [Aphanomyces cochlioides]
MSTSSKRRFSDEEDISLLRKVNAKLPFQAGRGRVMESWTTVAEALNSQEDFVRPGFDAKRAMNRFTILLDTHRNAVKMSARASGVAEEYGEKEELLDELLNVYDEAKEQEQIRNEKSKREADRVEMLGHIVREEALQSLGKRKAPQESDTIGSSNGNKFVKIRKQS